MVFITIRRRTHQYRMCHFTTLRLVGIENVYSSCIRYGCRFNIYRQSKRIRFYKGICSRTKDLYTISTKMCELLHCLKFSICRPDETILFIRYPIDTPYRYIVSNNHIFFYKLISYFFFANCIYKSMLITLINLCRSMICA